MRADHSSNSPDRPSKSFRPDKIPSFKNQNVASSRPESTSVQDRIRQWQAQGAADALAPDNLSVRSMPLSECPSTASRPQSIYGDSIKQGTRGRSEDKSAEHPQETRSQSTPRKRIISDGHWQAKKQDKELKNSSPRSKPQQRSSRLDLTYTSTDGKRKERRTSRQQQKVMFSEASHQTSLGDDGIRVTALPDPEPEPVQDNTISEPADDIQVHVDEELARYLTAESIYSGDLERRSDTSIQPDEYDETPRRRSKYVETLGRTTSGPEEAGLPRSKKGTFFGKTKDLLFLKSEGGPAGNNRIPSIEAWLDEQPDPFTDQDDRRDLPPVEIPQPLRKRSERKRTSKEATTVLDPNKIWDSLPSLSEPQSPPQQMMLSENRRRSRRSSNGTRESTPKTVADSETIHKDADASPSGLRRRGARVRRQREAASREGSAEPDTTELARDLVEEPLATVVENDPIVLARRSCPPTGVHRLSTIASVETFRETQVGPTVVEETNQDNCGLKRKLTTHEDLMSVLSVSRRGKSIRSAKSVRTLRPPKKSASAEEILVSFVADEEKYARELRTLVDGVIPVLLQCVLSKTDSAAAAGLFTSSPTAQGDFSFTRPIIDMGIALERLKSLHNRIPFRDIDSLLKWAQTAQKAYTDYLQAWRLGFQDVVVNLAPLDGVNESEAGLARDDSGDLIDTDGKKVDVAYLLKRPLVRVKALSKTFGHIRDECDKSLATQIASIYADLTALAKRRFQEEQARLEDEAAANIDATRVRDIKTLAVAATVVVDRSRRVKARDFFNLTLYHTSGQRMDCGIELIFRDSARGEPTGGDILICEVDDTGKWLLFAPVELNCISARRGEGGFDLVIMIRGRAGFGQEWHELLALKTDDPEAVTEWMTMLGSNPLPPRLNRTSSFVEKPKPLAIAPPPGKEDQQQEQNEQTQGLRRTDIDVPIGEPSVIGLPSDISRRPAPARPFVNKPLPSLNLGGGLATKPSSYYQQKPTPIVKQAVPSVLSSDRSTISDLSSRETSTTVSSSSKPLSSLQPGKDAEVPRSSPRSPPVGVARTVRSSPSETSAHSSTRTLRRTDNESREWMTSPTSRQRYTKEIDKNAVSEKPISPSHKSPPPTHSTTVSRETKPQRPDYKRALSSTPSKDLPTVTKVRTPTQQPPFQSLAQTTTKQEQCHQPRQEANLDKGLPPREKKNSPKTQVFTEDVPMPPPHTSRQTKTQSSGSKANSSLSNTPPQPSKAVLQPRPNSKPSLELQPTPSPSDQRLKRRTSSPLKHEYAPSTSSDSSSDYETESVSDSSSDTSEDMRSEHGDMPTPLIAITGGERRSSKPGQPPASLPSTGTRTLAPSDSASQGPYRKVPSSATVPMNKRSKTIALICSWSDRGMWEQIHPDECSIVISPGLIEAFEMSAAHSDPRVSYGSPTADNADSRSSSLSQQPLVAFELTPIVPLRRGTALDISIRSPPTPNSKIRTTNNVMFRSRNAEECEALYGMINWARCNNPTYIQLQMARPARQPSVSFNVGQGEHSRSKSSSWFSFGSQKKSSYRASSAPTPASIDMSVESSGTMSSAFSALKRFTANSGFNLNRSSVLRRPGSASAGGSLYSSSSGTGTGSGSSTPAPSQLGFIPGKDGPNVPSTSAAAADGGGMINMMKIRLYVRKGQHWENLGAARLSVLPAPVTAKGSSSGSGNVTPNRSGTITDSSPPPTPAHGRSPSSVMTVGQPGQNRGPRLPSSNNTPHRVHGNGREKRLLIVRNKERDTVLLDSILGESCFERIMQTGIAVKVWNETDAIAHTGGVTLGRETVYMMQFPSTREAGWVFGLCGTYRYGVGLGNE